MNTHVHPLISGILAAHLGPIASTSPIVTMPGNFGSPLIATEHGVGFLDRTRGELRMPFGIHVAPVLQSVRPATADECRTYFEDRRRIRREMTAYYDRNTYTGD